MNCPFCGLDTRVYRTITPDPDQRVIVRERQCHVGAAHRFTTEELERLAIVDVAVHQRGSNGLAPYSRDVLAESLRNALLASGSDAGQDASLIADLLERIEYRITRRNVKLRRLDEHERHRLDARSNRLQESDPERADVLRKIRVVVSDGDIEDAVDSELSQSSKTRSKRVMYALTVQGRRGSQRVHPGWRDADDALAWLISAFPHLGREGLPDRVSTTPIHIAVPTVRETPRFVYKRDLVRTDFDLGRFERAIGKALYGRDDEDLKVAGVVWATMARLAGQSIVHSSQLAVIALEILRATDEIAYLRAAVRVKGLTQVTDIFNEAAALRAHPSQKHVFSPPTQQIIVPATVGGNGSAYH